MSEEVKKAVCVWCKGECGVLVHVKDGRLIKAVEDPDWPRKVYPRTRACPRLKAAKEWFYHPERVNFPLKRAAERGENKWQRMSWTEAFDEIAERIQKIKDAFGGEAIVHTQGTSYREEYPLRARFFSQLGGSPTYAGASNICFMPRSTMANAIVGMFSHYSVGPKSKCIVLLGAEPLNARPINAQVIRDAKKRGTKLIVIDPRFTRSASLADTWLQLRPGTDCALLLGMIYVIIEEGLYDKDFVEKWCHGFDQLRKHVKRYTPEEVEKITLVSSEKLREAARIYAGNRPGAILEGVATEQSQNAGEILQARWILAGLTGNIDVEGGEELTGPHPTIISCREVEPGIRFSPEQQGKQIASDRFRLLSWQGQRIITENMKKVWGKTTGVPSVSHGPSMYRTILTGKPYPIRGVITMASNPMVTQPDTKLIYKALKSLDLYVVKDFWMTPSAQLADYVLPSSSWLERPILWDFCGYDRYMVSGEAAVPQTVPGEYEHKTDFDFWRELGLRLGQGDYWPWKDLEEYYDARLAPTGLKHKEYVYTVRCEHKKPGYKKYERTGFATPTGKVELYSTVLEKLDYPPLPSFKE
ncbi:MAG: molybdopterin-dependent oxidoreductase, partial [Dehalococcoidia bacterium]|nr:molybdopterin-dependent oxidoreductase [Dehalococcoidia bacterium]